MSLPAFAFEINPSAWAFSKLYEFASVHLAQRDQFISELRDQIDTEFPIVIFSEDKLPFEDFKEKIIHIGHSLSDQAKILCNALVVLLDIDTNPISSNFVQGKLGALAHLVRRLPYSENQIVADLQDARNLPLRDQSVDFVISSPPYINVFNYHQNYRRSVELLGWNLLRVARSEIGSNRANRGNRFYTVAQYSIDMAKTLQELARVLRSNGRAVLIIGYESKVLGTPFYNADIIERLVYDMEMFDIVLRQQRVFTNRYGQSIREDILNLQRRAYRNDEELPTLLGRSVAENTLRSAITKVPQKNKQLLLEATSRISEISGTPIFNSMSYNEYQTRDKVMMVGESKGTL